MARKKSPTLTDAELRLMDVLWCKGKATVGEVAAAFSGPGAPAYSTVLTMLRILEQKGYLRHTKEGRAFVYSPVIDRGEARRNAVRHMVSRFFDGSPELLVLNILENEEFDADDIARLRRRIEEGE